MLNTAIAPPDYIHHNRAAGHVYTRSAPADQVDALNGGGLNPCEYISERLRLRYRLLPVYQHVPGRAGVASYKAGVGNAETRNALHHVESILRLCLTEEVRSVANDALSLWCTVLRQYGRRPESDGGSYEN
jgi:hypothetical protein